MSQLFRALLHDEQGFILSAELVLIATVLVIGLIVGLSEVQHAVVTELNDVGDAVGALNQSYFFSGLSSRDKYKLKSRFSGSKFGDQMDDCDNNQCEITCAAPHPEGSKGGHY